MIDLKGIAYISEFLSEFLSLTENVYSTRLWSLYNYATLNIINVQLLVKFIIIFYDLNECAYTSVLHLKLIILRNKKVWPDMFNTVKKQ